MVVCKLGATITTARRRSNGDRNKYNMAKEMSHAALGGDLFESTNVLLGRLKIFLILGADHEPH